jgi:hypothetical protein
MRVLRVAGHFKKQMILGVKTSYNHETSFGSWKLFKLQLLVMILDTVIGHSSGGIFIPAKWRDSLKACCWSKRRQKLVTRSYSHSNRLMATRSKYAYTPRSMGNSYAEYPPPH